MLRGMEKVSYWADDVEAAADWYGKVLGIDPYFRRPETGPPAYVEFRVGDFGHELGLIDRRYAGEPATPGVGGVVLYWHVDDVTDALSTLLTMGAREHAPPTDRGAGFVTASVVDPFGNILGIMFNPHYLQMVRSSRAG